MIVKQALLSLASTLLVLAAMDAVSRQRYRAPLRDWVTGEAARERFHFDGPLARYDPVVGYSGVPGEHRVLMTRGLHRLIFHVRNEADGYRTTGGAAGKPELWISGCSYTWGLGLNDEETYPWLVQKALPDWTVRNLAGNGYGSVQGLLQLEHAAHPPRMAVFVYNGFHPPRNVAARSYLQMMNAAGEAFGKSGAEVPRAVLDPDLRFTRVKLFQGMPPEPEPDPAYALRVTRAVFTRIFEICRARGIRPVFATQSPPDAILEHARATGFEIADLYIDLDEDGGRRYRLLPVDAHPNARAHQEYARRLLTALAYAPGRNNAIFGRR